MTDDERHKLAQVYLEVFSRDNGRAVLADMQSVYHDRMSETEEENLASIPHPFRAYYIEGQRSVFTALRDVLKAAESGDV